MLDNPSVIYDTSVASVPRRGEIIANTRDISISVMPANLFRCFVTVLILRLLRLIGRPSLIWIDSPGGFADFQML